MGRWRSPHISSIKHELGTATGVFLDAFMGSQLDPHHYLTKSKLAVGIAGQVNAGGSLGLKKAATDKEKDAFVSKGSHADERMADNFSSRWIDLVVPSKNHQSKKTTLREIFKRSANIDISALLGAQITGAVEWDRKLKAQADGRIVIAKEVMSVSVELAADTHGKVNLPLLGKWGPIFQRGMGIKFVFDQDKDDYQMFFFTTKGDMDLYEAAAYEAQMEGNEKLLNILEDDDLDIDFVFNLIKDLKIKKRIHLLDWNPASRIANSIKQREKENQALQKKEYQSNFYDFDAFLEFELDFGVLYQADPSILKGLVRDFIEYLSAKGLTNAIQEFAEWMNELRDSEFNNFLSTEEYKRYFEIFKDDFFSSIELHTQMGVGVAAGFQVAGGLKAKLFGDVHGGLVYHIDIREFFLSQVSHMLNIILTHNFPKSDIPKFMHHLFEQELCK
ncbi:hypothetical protein [Persicobacter psychrovividus]|uniref:hypothetical protein n=1 Tax=Persicobacter psychrovividus TaxID=387638 RepID=UPI0030CA44D6